MQKDFGDRATRGGLQFRANRGTGLRHRAMENSGGHTPCPTAGVAGASGTAIFTFLDLFFRS